MTFLILPTDAAYVALEQAVRASRSWAGKEQQTGTFHYCGEPVPDVNGDYPFPIQDLAAEKFVRKFDNGKYADAVLVESVEWPEYDGG